jgi:hypothetical protein
LCRDVSCHHRSEEQSQQNTDKRGPSSPCVDGQQTHKTCTHTEAQTLSHLRFSALCWMLGKRTNSATGHSQQNINSAQYNPPVSRQRSPRYTQHTGHRTQRSQTPTPTATNSGRHNKTNSAQYNPTFYRPLHHVTHHTTQKNTNTNN